MPETTERVNLCLQTAAPGEGDQVVLLHASLDGTMLALQRSTVFLQFIHLGSSKMFVQVCTSVPCKCPRDTSSTRPVNTLLQWRYTMLTPTLIWLCTLWSRLITSQPLSCHTSTRRIY